MIIFDGMVFGTISVSRLHFSTMERIDYDDDSVYTVSLLVPMSPSSARRIREALNIG
jgi:hypothetical protein